jgi:hypothetical protein
MKALTSVRLLHTHGVLRMKVVVHPGYEFKGAIKIEPNPDAVISFSATVYGIFGFRTNLKI